MLLLALAITIVGAVVSAVIAGRLARARGRSVLLWPALTVLVGAAIFAFEEILWVRPAGDAASPGGLDMQMLLPVVGMLGTALLVTYLPARDA